MKVKFFAAISLLISFSVLSAEEIIVDDWFMQVTEKIHQEEYQPSWQILDFKGEPFSQQRLHITNRIQDIRIYCDDQRIEIMPRDAHDALLWRLILQPFTLINSKTPRCHDKPEIINHIITYTSPILDQKIMNLPEGIYYQLTIHHTATNEPTIKLATEISSKNMFSKTVKKDHIIFISDQHTLSFKLRDVRDGMGNYLPAFFEVNNGSELTLQVQPTTHPTINITLLITSSQTNQDQQEEQELSGLNPTANWTFSPDQISAQLGSAVCTAGDVNGDGFSDIIVGAHLYDGGQSDEGRVYVFHGSTSGLPSTPDWTMEIDQAAAHFGVSATTAGDVNGDGYCDVIIGADYYDNSESNEGGAFVYYGSESGLSSSADWTAESDQVDAFFGYSVFTAGDVNGDGYSDVIVGAYAYDNGSANEGRAFVFHGSTSGLSSTADWTEEPDLPFTSFGYAVATAGDVNGDGYSDVIVGARDYDNGQTNEGAAYLYHGSASGLSTTADWFVESNTLGALYGNSVCTAGDVNGDGYSDVIVGAQLYYNGQVNEGRAFVYHGSGSGLSSSADWEKEIDLTGVQFGCCVSTAGDVNGDGYGDVVIGAFAYSNGHAEEGGTFLYSGSVSGLDTASSWSAESDQTLANFGYRCATAGDVNGDGFSDVIVGAYRYDDGQVDEGRAYLYFGGPDGPSTAADWVREGVQSEAWYGHCVRHAGDVNGDGYSDVIVGVPFYDNGQDDEGRAYVYHGSASGIDTLPDWTEEPDQAYAEFGSGVCGAGDVNGDGYSDVIVGARYYDNGELDEGAAFAYHGSNSGLSTSPDWTMDSDQASSEFGCDVATAGDVNGDGYSDVIVAAHLYDNGQADEGCAFVYHGSASGLASSPNWTGQSDQANAMYGNSVACAGDVNGDGYSDVIVGDTLYDNGNSNEGVAFVYHGSSTGLSSSANWSDEVDQDNAHFGCSVASAGDVNGDGYSDIIVGAQWYDNESAWDNEGHAYVYYGSSSGLSTNPDWDMELNINYSLFGSGVSTAGDVNGDGYSDVIIGADEYSNGEGQEGGAFIYYGSASGLSSSADWSVESDIGWTYMGNSVSTAGDVNGDGYSDVIVGHYLYDGFSNEGAAYIYYGNNGGLAMNPRQSLPDGSRLVQLLNNLNYSGLGLRFIGRTPGGRGKVKLEWDIKQFGTLFTGDDERGESDWYDTGTSGVEIFEEAYMMAPSTAYHWRTRLLYSPLNYFGSAHSRWFSIGPNGWNEMDFRNGSTIGTEENTRTTPEAIAFQVFPTLSRKAFSIHFSFLNAVPRENINGSLKIFDAAGRVVKTLCAEKIPLAADRIFWFGDDDHARAVPSGVYFIRLDAEEFQKTEKVLLVR